MNGGAARPRDHGRTDPGGAGHHHPCGVVRWVRGLLGPRSRGAAERVDHALETSLEGLRVELWSLAALGATAAFQAVLVFATGSAALLSDTLHNVADALTAVPLSIAFLLGRRAPTRRYTYGYGRAEDLAGAAVVLAIAASAAFAGYVSIRRLAEPRGVDAVAAVAVAGLAGFAGNEAVARFRIRVGRRIGSAALVADGLHARTDGFTSLAVAVGAIGVALGWESADPVAGLVITAAILSVLYSVARDVLRRLMDAVNPDLVDRAERTLMRVAGVERVGEVRLRWIGHALRAEATVVVDMSRTVAGGHAIAEDARHALLNDIPRLSDAIVHVDPCGHGAPDPHRGAAHHEP